MRHRRPQYSTARMPESNGSQVPMEDFFSVETDPPELEEMDEFDFTDDTENEAPLFPRGATLHLLKLPDLQVGDIVLSPTNRPESIAIRAATSSDASHSAIYIGHGDVIE